MAWPRGEPSARYRRASTVQLPVGDGRLIERFGALEILFTLAATEEALLYSPAGARLGVGPLRIPLPSWSSPSVEARASSGPGDEDVHVEVKISLPLLGPITSYGGWMKLVQGGPHRR